MPRSGSSSIISQLLSQDMGLDETGPFSPGQAEGPVEIPGVGSYTPGGAPSGTAPPPSVPGAGTATSSPMGPPAPDSPLAGDNMGPPAPQYDSSMGPPAPKTGSERTLGDKNSVIKAIRGAAKKHGVDPARLLALAMHETGGSLDPGAINPSGAKGLFQALPAWAEQYGIKGHEFNAEASSDAAARSLKGSIGAANPYVSYLIHNQGRSGAETIIRAAAGEAPLTAKVRRNIAAQYVKGTKGAAKEGLDDQALAQRFMAGQRKRFMSYYDKARSMLGEEDDAERIASQGGSRSFDWDAMMSRSMEMFKAGAQKHVADSMAEGARQPRTKYGGKIQS